MSDDNLGGAPAAPVASESNVPNTSQPAPSVTHDEPMFNQRKVGAMISEARHEGYERAKREYESKMQSPPPQSQPSSMGGVQQLSQDDIRRLVAEESQKNLQNLYQESQRRSEEQRFMQRANDFTARIEAGKAKFQDFDEVTKGLSWDKVPHVVDLAIDVDNTDAVMYELAKNRMKLANLTVLAMMDRDAAAAEMLKLSQSIKTNEEAQRQAGSKAPLSQFTHSSAGMGNGSAIPSIRDLRKQPWMKV